MPFPDHVVVRCLSVHGNVAEGMIDCRVRWHNCMPLLPSTVDGVGGCDTLARVPYSFPCLGQDTRKAVTPALSNCHASGGASTSRNETIAHTEWRLGGWRCHVAASTRFLPWGSHATHRALFLLLFMGPRVGKC